MEKIHEMVNKITEECERQGIPFLACFGLDKIAVYEYAPDNTPERIRKTRTTLLNVTSQARRQLEIQA